MFLTNLAYGGGGKLLRPGDRVNVQTPAGTHGVTTLSPDVAQSLTNVGLNRVFGQFLKQFADVPANTKALAAARFQRGAACAYDLLQAHGQGDLPTQLPEYSRGLYGDLEEGLIALQFATYVKFGVGSATADAAEKLVKSVWTANKHVDFIKAGSGILDLGVALASHSDFVADHFMPAPSLDGKGRPVQQQCLRATGSVRLYVDEACQDADNVSPTNFGSGGGGTTGLPNGFMVQTNGHDSFFMNKADHTYGSVPTPGDYDCLAEAGIPVRFYTDPTTIPGYTASGEVKFAAPRTGITPELLEGNVNGTASQSRVRMLRSATSGITFLYVGNGRIEQIRSDQTLKCFSTGTHQCMAYDCVSNDDLNQFQFLSSNTPLCT